MSSSTVSVLPLALLRRLGPYGPIALNMWTRLVALDRDMLVNASLLFAVFTTLRHYLKAYLYAIARRTCVASVRISGDNLLFSYLQRWISETKLSKAHSAVEAEVPHHLTWDDEQEAAANMINNSREEPQKLINYRAMIDRRPIKFKPFGGRHFFWYKGNPIMLSHNENSGPSRSAPSDRRRQYVVLECLGRSTAVIHDLLQEAQAYSLSRVSSQTVVYRADAEYVKLNLLKLSSSNTSG